MESKAPYRKLNSLNKRQRLKIFSICFGRGSSNDDDDNDDNNNNNNKDKVITSVQALEKLDDAIEKIKMKINYIDYRMNATWSKAQQASKKGDKFVTETKLYEFKRHELSRIRFIRLKSHLQHIHDTINDTSTLNDIMINMHVANTTLTKSLERFDLNKIDDLMDSLTDNKLHLRDINNALKNNDGEVDISREMDRLEEELANDIDLPSVPIKKEKENKKRQVNKKNKLILM